jgi:hypothetical protein
VAFVTISLILKILFKKDYFMKRNMQILLLFFFVFTLAACIPVPVAVGPQPAGYDDQYGSGYSDEYVDVPIAYGEPYYFTPPIVVTYPYDYFTYEMVDGFVDIVFWRDGHRYRHERWHDNGRLVSDADMRSRKRHQRIRVSELNRYREKLRQNHNIYHPDSYYGLKPRPKQQIQQHPQQTEQHPQWQQQRPQQTEQKPQLEQQPPRQVEERLQWGAKPQQPGQKSQLEMKPPRQEEQRQQMEKQQTQQSRQRPQWGQKQPQQVRQKPQLGQQQPKQENLRQMPQQTRRGYQKEQQKIKTERQKKTKEVLRKPAPEQDKKK